MCNHRTLIVVPSLVLALLVGCGREPSSGDDSEEISASSDLKRRAGPTGLAAAAGDATVTLTWTASTGARSYLVKRATTQGGPYTQLATASSPAYTDTAVTNGVAYYYVVSALTWRGESRDSNEASATPQAPVVNPTPTPTPTPTPPPPPPTGNGTCGMQLAASPAIFCETFDAPAGIGNRAGDLDGNVWGVSRGTGAWNFGQGMYDEWNPTTLVGCDGTLPQKVLAPDDILICDGQLREASNDNNSGEWDAGTVTSMTIYPKQPFDFAGRTGTVSFDISNDSAGTHSAWPEFWMSNLPVPVPFSHFDGGTSPQHGFGIRFGGTTPIGQWGGCPNGNNLDKYRWSVDGVAVYRDYVLDDTGGYGPGQVQLTTKDCVIASNGAGVGAVKDMNHVELRISQSKIEVWATDAGVAPTPSTLRLIAEITNANLSFTRGLIWLEDVHYNADKGPTDRPSQREHTFVWDNVAFDGPFTYRDFSYDALDNTDPRPNGAVNLGKFADANQTTTWNVLNMPANRQAAVVRVLFNYYSYDPPSVLNVIVNGHAHTAAPSFPDDQGYSTRTFAVAIPITDLVTGTNVVQLGGDVGLGFANVNIVLVDVPNGVPVLPGADNTYPN